MDEDDDLSEMEVDPPPLTSKNGKKLSRGEKSRIAAKNRRDKENVAMNALISELPVNDNVLKKMDKSSVIKLATCYIKIKHFLQKDMVAREKKQSQLTKPSPAAAVVAAADADADEDQPGDEEETKACPLLEGEGPMMLEALNGFLIFISRKGTIKFISGTVTDHIGLYQENLIGKNVAEIVHPNDQPELLKQFSAESSNGKTKAITDGSSAPSFENNSQKVFYVRMKYISRGQGKLKGTGFILVQWTGKLKTHLSTKTCAVVVDGLVAICRPMQTSSVVEIRMDGNMFMSRHDLGMTFTFCDTRIITLIGYEPDEVIGKTAYTFHNPIDAPKVSDCHQNLIVKGTSVSKYYRFLGKNENWVWLQTRATIIYNTNNKPQYIVCMNYVISEEEGERYLMLEEHKHANNSLDNICLTLPDNHITVAPHPPCTQLPTPGPRIVELPDDDAAPRVVYHGKTPVPCIEELSEENLEKTACLNGELDQPQPAPTQTSMPQCMDAVSSAANGYLQNASTGFSQMVNGYQQTGYSQSGSQKNSSVAEPLAQSAAEGSPESTTSTLSPCPQQDQYNNYGGSGVDQNLDLGTVSLLRDSQSYSEDGGYESATSPYSSSYLSPQIMSPGSFTSDNRTECVGYSDAQASKNGGFNGVGYSDTAACAMSASDTAELRETENILEALLEGFEGQAQSGNLDVSIAAICSTIENLSNHNAPLVSTQVKSPGCGVQKHRASTAMKKQKDKSVLRSILTMPEDDIPRHSQTFINKAKVQTAARNSDSDEGQMECSSSSAQNSPPSGKNGKVASRNGFQDSPCGPSSVSSTCSNPSDILDLQEMPSDITDFVLPFLDSLTEAQTQAVIADLSNETLMDTSECDLKKDLFSTIACDSTDNGYFNNTLTVSSPQPTSFCQTYNSPTCSKQRSSFGHSSATVTSTSPCTSYQGQIIRPTSSSSHDHVYHQSSSKFAGNGNNGQNVRSHTPAGSCGCSPRQSQFTQTRLNPHASASQSRVSELERHLREAGGLFCRGDEMGMGGSSRPFLRQLLTGELTKDKYMQMERERCEFSKGIRPK